MSTITERKIGEVFQDGNITLKVEEGNYCIDCFYKSKMGRCTAIDSMISSCSPIDRSDNKNIIFKKIESNKKEIMRDVILIAGIPNPNNEKDYLKIQTVKSIKEILGLGLKEAKDLVDNIPIALVRRVTDEMAENLRERFEKEGMKVEVKDTLTNEIVYQTKVPDFEETDSVEEVKILKERIEAGEDVMVKVLEGHEATDIKEPHYWIMGTPDRGDDVYAILKDKDPLIQSKSSISANTIEDPSLLLWISDDHKVSAISTENNVSLINLIINNWTELELPWKPKDKELVWVWENDEFCRRSLIFYDAKNKCCFEENGERNGYDYDNYAPFEGELPEWAKEALKRLED